MFDNVTFTGHIDLGSVMVAILGLVGIYRTYIAIKISNLKTVGLTASDLQACKEQLSRLITENAELKARLAQIEAGK